MSEDQLSWYQLVEEIADNHNGVMSVELFFGHDGHYVCEFRPYRPDPPIARGESGYSMQEAVERCLAAFQAREINAKT